MRMVLEALRRKAKFGKCLFCRRIGIPVPVSTLLLNEETISSTFIMPHAN